MIKFWDEREWKKFHTPKNVAIALNVEAAELLELFQWTDEPRISTEVEKEAADILYHLLLFCHESHIDLGEAFLRKLEDIASRYPIEKAKGNPKKYTDYK